MKTTRSSKLVLPTSNSRQPLLVLHGTGDPFVYPQLQSAPAARMTAAGMPVTYKAYAGADHAQIITLGRPDMVAFLKANLQ